MGVKDQTVQTENQCLFNLA